MNNFLESSNVVLAGQIGSNTLYSLLKQILSQNLFKATTSILAPLSP